MKTLAPSLDYPGHEEDDLKTIAQPLADSMTPRKTHRFMLVAVILFLVSFGVVAQFSKPLSAGIVDSAAALTIIAACAVGVERAIETFWTYIGLTQGSWWPLGPVREQLDGLISGLDASFEPFYQEAHATMQSLQQAETWAQDKLEAAAKDLDKIKKHVDELRQLPIDSQRVQLIAASASRSVEYFSKKYPEIKDAAELASFGIKGVDDFVATFKDNPGRRLISLFAGSIAGLVIAGVIGLDVFQAVLQTPAAAQAVRQSGPPGYPVQALPLQAYSSAWEQVRLMKPFGCSRNLRNCAPPKTLPSLCQDGNRIACRKRKEMINGQCDNERTFH
jgi:hypothetical protein